MIDLEQLIEQVVRRVLAEQTPATAVQYVTVAEYATTRDIAQSTVRQAIREKRLDAIRAGRAVRVPANAEIRPRTANDDVTERAARKLGLVRGGRP